jgi:hypothetical protein
MQCKFLPHLAIAMILLLQSCSKVSEKTSGQTSPVQMVSSPAGTNLSVDLATGYNTFQFISANGGLSPQVANFSLFDGGLSEMVAYTGSAFQQWRITDAGNGYFTIMNDASGKFATSYPYQGKQILVQGYADTTTSGAQLWSIISVGDGGYKVINKASGLAITNAGAGNLALSPYAGNSSQWWGYHLLPNMAYRDDAVVRYFERSKGSISFDQVNSIPLTYGANNGKSLWIGEDTFTDNNGGWEPATRSFPCYGGDQIQFFDVHNSALLQPASHSWDPAQTPNLVTHNSVYKYEILASPDPTNHGGTYTWPGVGVEIDNHVYMYAHEGGGAFDETVMYDFTESTDGLDWGTAVRHEVPGLSTQTTIGYAIGWVKANDGYVYAYGGLTDAFGGSYLQLARFATGTPFTWEFWDGSAWSPTVVTTSASQIRVNNSNSAAIKANSSVCYINGKFVLVEMDFGYGCPSPNSPQNIYVSTSSSPTGPFSARQAVFTIEDRINGVLSNHYVINAHPEFDNGKNELLVTYCINYTGCTGVSPCTNNLTDPYYYEAKAVRIPYSQIGL